MMRTPSVLATLVVATVASAQSITTWTTPKLAVGETTRATQRWASPTGHRVVILAVETKAGLVLRAAWNDPKPRTQDIAMPASGAVTFDDAMGELIATIKTSTNHSAVRMSFTASSGFTVVKQATFTTDKPTWLASPAPKTLTERAQALGESLRLQRAPTKVTVDAALIATWTRDGFPSVGLVKSCDPATSCCTFLNPDGSPNMACFSELIVSRFATVSSVTVPSPETTSSESSTR
jgi:hypothetical protein